MSRVYCSDSCTIRLAQTVPPDVLLVKPVIAQVTATELSGWLGRVDVHTNYTRLEGFNHQEAPQRIYN